MLSQLVQGRPDDAIGFLKGKLALRYLGRDLEAIRALALAQKHDSLAEFKQALETYRPELQEDEVVKHSINDLYEKMVEQNLLSIIKPYSVIQVSHIARKIELSPEEVEKKLCKMVLDKKVGGVLDHMANQQVFVLHEEDEASEVETAAMETFKAMARVMNHLTNQAKAVV